MPDVRLIDANALNTSVALYMAENAYLNDTPLDILRMVSRWIAEAPTIDAVPVVHGRVVWKNRFMGGFVPDITITDRAGEKHTGTLDTTHYEPVPYCSECGKELGVSSLAYCPNCGAKMDAKED